MADKKTNGRGVAEQKERDFLMAYYGLKSPTRFDPTTSAIAAGYTPRMALWNANRLLAKFHSKSVKDCVEAVGITPAALAVMLRENLDLAEGKDQLSGLRLAMANRGEQTDSASSQKNYSFAGPTMVIVGATPERLEALRRGGAPIEKGLDYTPGPLPAPDEDTIEVEAVEVGAGGAGEDQAHAEHMKPDAHTLSSGEFSGTNLTEARKSKAPSY